MTTIGITGIIGSGKTTVSAILKKKGLPVIDLDELAKATLSLKEVHEEITEKIGKEFVVNGEVAVERLRDTVFADKRKLAELEGIVHPRVKERLWWVIGELKEKGEKTVIIDGPLLFETGLYKKLDKIVVVAAGDAQIRARLIKRGMFPEDIEKRISHQIPLSVKEKSADLILHNNGNREDLEREVANLMERIKEWEVKPDAPQRIKK